MPHGWLKSERRSYGVWDTGCYCNACQLPGIAASFSMGNRLLAQRLPSLLPINKTAHVHTRRGCLLCASICVRNQDTGQRNSVPPTPPLNNQQNDPVVYLHFGELAQCLYLHCLLSTITEPRLCTRTQALPQCLPVFPPVDYRPWTCICTHTRVNWRSTCRHCLLWTTLPSCVPAHILERDCSTLKRCLLSTPVLDAYRHEHPGELAQLLPVLHRIDKRSWTSICTHGQSSWHSAYRCCLLLTIGPVIFSSLWRKPIHAKQLTSIEKASELLY